MTENLNRVVTFAARSNNALPTSPRLLRRSSVQTEYELMLVQLDHVPWQQNLLAGVFTWLLLAGYIVFPGTFTSLNNSRAVRDSANSHRPEKALLKIVQNMPLLGFTAACCVIGAIGIVYLGWIWRTNYIWLVNPLFL